MNYLSKLAAATCALFTVSAMAHPGHTHTVQSSYHMVVNNLLIAAVIVAVLLAARTLKRSD